MWFYNPKYNGIVGSIFKTFLLFGIMWTMSLFIVDLELVNNTKYTKNITKYQGGDTYAGFSQETTDNYADRCLGMELGEKMDMMLSNVTQVFVLMPAKAAGSTMKTFGKKCAKTKNITSGTGSVIDSPGQLRNFITDSYELPSVFVSHLSSYRSLVTLTKYISKSALIIYIHREERYRFISAIRQVLTRRVCNGSYKDIDYEVNDTHCILDEDTVLDDIIAKKRNEIGHGSSNLDCNTYEAVEKNAPNMVIINYEQANRLQLLLAKHHCPELLHFEPIEANVAYQNKNENHMTYLVRLKSQRVGSRKVVELEDWLEKKREYLEFSLKTRGSVSCWGKTKSMEDDLFSCTDQALKASWGSSSCL